MEYKDLWKKTRPYLANKYVIAFLIFIVWISFFDENRLISRIGAKAELNKLEYQKDYYREQIKINKERLKQLKTNKDNLEKFAREQYIMRKPNEDVFVVVTDEE